MDRIIVKRIAAVVSLIGACAPRGAQAQQCVNPSLPECQFVADHVGDYEVIEDSTGQLLFVTNVGEDTVPWGGPGNHPVMLRVLDSDGVNPVNHALASDYQGMSGINGPEFLVPPQGSAVDLGVLYRGPTGIQAVWRLPGASPSDFSRDHLGAALALDFWGDVIPEVMGAPQGAYPAAGIPEGTGVYGLFGVPPTSPNYAQCPLPGHCYTDLNGVAVVAAVALANAALAPDSVRSIAQHPDPLYPNRFATTSAAGLIVWERTPGVLTRLATFTDPLPPKPTVCTNPMPQCDAREMLRGEVHPTTGEVTWFLLAGDALTTTDGEEVQVLTETTDLAGNVTLTLDARRQYAGWGEHLHTTKGNGGIAAYFQLRDPENSVARQGSYAVEVDAAGVISAAQKFSACSHATELVWNSTTSTWMSYAASQGLFGPDVNVYRCNL